ncbi:MAG: Atg14 domain-containing protein [Bacteroides sp.]|nr:Atg14 domain-containing protein [Bacteroides sp.]
MASTKNNTSAESNGGFKTAAFGFDKNDVNMYIASLRKKMKNMEEEFEQKLAQALENPTASNDVLKHEREVIRAETEKIWGEKLNERNNILKQQQARINELENELKISQDKVASLRTQLAAATSDTSSDAVISARAAKAYMQFTRELRSISSSVEKTLIEMEQRWRGEFGTAAAEMGAQEDESAENTAALSASEASETLIDSSVNTEEVNDDSITDNLSDTFSEIKAEVSEAKIDIDENLLAEPLPEEPKPAEPDRSAKKVKGSKKKAEAAPAPKPIPKPEPIPEPEPVMEEVDVDLLLKKPKAQPPVAAPAANDDFGSLLAEDSPMADDLIAAPEPAPTPKPKKAAPAPKIEIDDDLSSLLADDLSDFLVEPADNTVGANDDFESLLAESEEMPDLGEDILINENEPKIVKGDDLDASLLSDIVINHDENIGDLGEMILEKENSELAEFGDMLVTAASDEERNDGLGISVGNIDFGMDAADELTESVKEAADAKKEEDPFDFSFLSEDSDDEEDDMSTDVSFSGML